MGYITEESACHPAWYVYYNYHEGDKVKCVYARTSLPLEEGEIYTVQRDVGEYVVGVYLKEISGGWFDKTNFRPIIPSDEEKIQESKSFFDKLKRCFHWNLHT